MTRTCGARRDHAEASGCRPTRRTELDQLIASFPDIDASTGMVGLRPAWLRELLGLR
ncbi:MAG: hypothetical protein M3186_11745 [Actinomycetota bacterium]|nr:hypothetical protein [Actinomycetota bacterium]